jgi:branched-chain amino acid transport system permease protein
LNQLLTATITGLAAAGIFAIAASGLVLTYTTTGIFNFAHGAIGMLGAFTFWQLHHEWGWPTWLALLVVVLVLAPALGVAIEVFIMRGLQRAPEATRVVVSVGLLVGMLAIGLWIWKPTNAYPIDVFWPGKKVGVFGVNLSWHLLFAMIVAVLVAIGLRLLLYRTRAGITMRATVEDRPLASLNGVRADRSAALAWAIGCALAALAGILIAPTLTLSHSLLTLLIIDAYAAAIIGRLRSLPLTFLGAAILGLARSYVITYLPSATPGQSGYRQFLQAFPPAVPIVVLFIALLLVPQDKLRMHRSRTQERQPRPVWRGTLLAASGVVAVGVVTALLVTPADASKGAKIFGLGIIALSLIPLVGFAGQISLCQMSFAAIGAITFSHLAPDGSPIGLLWAAIIAGAIGGLIALPALRLSGIYLALATAAFAVILDRWIFTWPVAHFGPIQISMFRNGNAAVKPLRLPFIGEATQRGMIVELAIAFALLSLFVVALRRSSFGDRLLAMKSSPAACATLGLDLTVTKLAVFTVSAAMAGVGGALYGGTLGSVSSNTFDVFQSLPLLLVTVAGGIATPGGAVFAGWTLGSLPIARDLLPSLSSAFGVLPALIGVTLGRTPNGVVPDLCERLSFLKRKPAVAIALLGVAVLLVALTAADVLTGWALLVLLALAGLVALAVARYERVVTEEVSYEWLGIERPFTAADVEELDHVAPVPALVESVV